MSEAPATRKLVKTREPGIFKRGGRYVVVYRDAYGKQHKRAGGQTLKAAKDVKATLRAEVVHGEDTEASREKFALYALRWIEHYAGRTNRGVRKATRDDYRARLEQDSIPYLGQLQMREIRPKHLDGLAERVAGRGVSANTVRLALAPVKALLADALQKGDIHRNPAAGWRSRYAQQSIEHDDEAGADVRVDEDVKALEQAELVALLDELPARWRLFYLFLANTGLRISEAVELRWRDIDFTSGRFTVNRRFYRGRVAPPKSNYGRRTVTLPPALADALQAFQGAPDGFVFKSAKGNRVDQSNVMSRVLKPAAVRAGLGEWVETVQGLRAESWVGHHTFRHTNATMLFRAGWNAKQVQMWLGHHSPAFTLATYVHLLPSDLPEPPDVLTISAIVGGNKGATQQAETGRNGRVGEVAGIGVVAAESLGRVRAV